MEDTTLSYGDKAVGLTFNPSGDPGVQDVKGLCAVLIDKLDIMRKECGYPSEKGAMFTLAIRELQSAQMWAVKAITWKD